MNIYWACVSLVLATALAKGGRPEQLAALILIVASWLSLGAAPDPYTSFRSVEWDFFAVDLFSFCCFLALALAANRYWPCCIAGMKLVPLAGHIAKLMDPEGISFQTYAFMEVALTYPYMLIILTAVARHQLRLAKRGEDAPWR